MLKISAEGLFDNKVLLVLEGSLSGAWVAEVDRAWHRVDDDSRGQTIRIDLSGVTFVSEEGKALLQQMCASGVEIFSSDLQTKALCEELSNKQSGAKSV